MNRQPVSITARLLREWPLPMPDECGDKLDRGRVVCVGGSPELPGAIVLAGTAALRAGAGSLRIGAPRALSVGVGVAIPEAMVFGLAGTRNGGIAATSADEIAVRAEGARAVLVGPGMADAGSIGRLLAALLPRLSSVPVVVLDALALDGAAHIVDIVRAYAPRVILTPHTGEMARLMNTDLAIVEADRVRVVHAAAERFAAIAVLKGAETLVATPDGQQTYCYRAGSVGLATSGSGDTLAGVIAGLAARGAEPAQAAVWAIYLHGSAGNRLTSRLGRVGFLARELLAEIPPVMAELEQ